MTDQTPEETLEHWRSQLAHALKAAPDLPWPNLIDWAEEAETLALKTCTKAGRAKLVTLEQRLTAMEKLATAWQKEAERARKDLADQADPTDTVEFLIWSAQTRLLTEEEVTDYIKTLRHCRFLAAESLHVCADTWNDAKKRVTALHQPVQHMGQTWCGECSVRRRTGPKTEEWMAFIPHPCPTLEALENKETP